MTQISERLRQQRQIQFNRECKYREYTAWRGLNLYLSELPRFQGKTFVKIIDDKIKKEKAPIQILDIGCGEGKFLLDCKEKWGSHVDCVGLSAFPYHEEAALSSKLKEKGIDIKIGDAHKLYDFVPQNSFDIITSSKAFRYFASPATALKMIYQSLKHDGVCFINDFTLRRNFEPYIDDLNELYKYLEKTYGFELGRRQLGWLSFKKQTERLNLPISFKKRPEDKLYAIGPDAKFVYRIK